MPLPRFVLIDTNILEQYGYDFSSPEIETFLKVAAANYLTLLLPNALEREVRRHIEEKSAKAQAALRKARHEAPFLQKWSNWPAGKKLKSVKDDIAASYLADWGQFLKHFKVEKLGYDGIRLPQIMDWYDQQQPPFGPGRKEKEFPDAFALASALVYATTNSIKVAVVSKDTDFAKFCAAHPELPYFPDLPTLTEAFISEIAKRPDAIKAAVAARPAEIIARIRESFPDLTFFPQEDFEGDVEDVQVESVKIARVHVIDIDEPDCTIAFDANVEFSAFVHYDDPDSMVIDSSEDFRMALHVRAGTVTETASISATITLEFDSDWKSILTASALEIEEPAIAVTSRPPIHDDDNEPPEGFDEPPDSPPDSNPEEPPHN